MTRVLAVKRASLPIVRSLKKKCGALPGLALLACGALASVTACGAESAVVVPAPAVDSPKAAGPAQTAVLAGGCFWGVQGVFQHMRGVRQAVSGYAGGDKASADYATVSSGRSGHAESVQITYDPAQVSFGEILQVFFSVVHDPTQLNRQGPDHGTQYRSAIFYANDEQKKIAEAYIAQLDKAKAYRASIVTRVDPLKGFFEAEAYHQDYLINNPRSPYIVINDLPKVQNFARTFPTFYRPQAVTVAKGR
jgi:peptide-methionine (S)-S-oxide reductase